MGGWMVEPCLRYWEIVSRRSEEGQSDHSNPPKCLTPSNVLDKGVQVRTPEKQGSQGNLESIDPPPLPPCASAPHRAFEAYQSQVRSRSTGPHAHNW